MRPSPCRLLLSGLFLSLGLSAAPIVINPVGFFNPNEGSVFLPFYLGPGEAPGRVAGRFSVPNAGMISSLNSLTVSVTVRDDESDPRRNSGESGKVEFVLDGFGLPVGNFSSLDVNGSTFSYLLDQLFLPAALEEMQDNGFFRVRVVRDSGDFYVDAISVSADGNTAVPEPASVGLVGGALVGLAAALRRGRQAV